MENKSNLIIKKIIKRTLLIAMIGFLFVALNAVGTNNAINSLQSIWGMITEMIIKISQEGWAKWVELVHFVYVEHFTIIAMVISVVALWSISTSSANTLSDERSVKRFKYLNILVQLNIIVCGLNVIIRFADVAETMNFNFGNFADVIFMIVAIFPSAIWQSIYSMNEGKVKGINALLSFIKDLIVIVEVSKLVWGLALLSVGGLIKLINASLGQAIGDNHAPVFFIILPHATILFWFLTLSSTACSKEFFNKSAS